MNYSNMPAIGDKVSALGYGCMRFPQKGIGADIERTRAQVLSAIERGVNYFDTAYIYPGSERLLGKILAEVGLRERVKIATKLPHIMIKDAAGMRAIFAKQLERLRTDYIDYYLIHNIGSMADWQRVKEMGALNFAQELRTQGKIHYFGFSFHGNVQTFRQVVDDYAWDFCQIQYNYLDENFQAGRQGLLYAAEKGLSVIAMEPLRGGVLGENIIPAAQKILRGVAPERSPAEWALRWLFAQPQVSVVLSGMGVEAHIDENIRVASGDVLQLTQSELDAIEKVKAIFAQKIKVGCTGCAYCLPCPYNVNIPACFALYNAWSVHGGLGPKIHYLGGTEGAANGKPSRAGLCKNCGLCVKRCPQDINVPEKLRETARQMEKPYLRIPARIVMKLMRR